MLRVRGRLGWCAAWVLAVCLGGAAGCSRQGLPPTGGAATPAAPAGESVSVFTLVGHGEGGRKKWEIRGQTADLMGPSVSLSPVSATSYGNVQMDLAAQQGRLDKATRDVRLEKDVVLTTSDGTRLTTDSLDWVQEEGVGRTSDWVTVTRPGMTVKGLGAVGHAQLKRVRLEKQVTVVLEDAAGKTVVTCDGPMEADHRRHKARFWRNVRVADSRGFIQSDRLDVALNPKTNQIDRATFWGHVRIRHGEEVAYANRVSYWQPLGLIRLVGHPRLMLQVAEEGGGE